MEQRKIVKGIAADAKRKLQVGEAILIAPVPGDALRA
jgi:hypothetical protein